jgi:prevent-host-death family protein
MMPTVTAFEAKTRFGELLDRVSKGEEVVITRHDKAVARLIRRAHNGPTRSAGAWRACASCSSGFDEDRRPSSRIGRPERPSNSADHDRGVRG